MRIATATLHSIAPYSQSRYHDTPKLDKERPDDYEMRTWANRLSVTDDGNVFIPPMAFKKSLETAARFLGQQIKGRGKSTYTKHFKAGVLVTDGLVLDGYTKKGRARRGVFRCGRWQGRQPRETEIPGYHPMVG